MGNYLGPWPLHYVTLLFPASLIFQSKLSRDMHIYFQASPYLALVKIQTHRFGEKVMVVLDTESAVGDLRVQKGSYSFPIL